MAYDASEWSDLFAAVAGAAAALTGLVFVAVSINVQQILEYDGLPERALVTVLVLLLPVLVSLVVLAPGQSTEAVGAEVVFLAAAMLAAVLRLLLGGDRHPAVNEHRLSQVVSLTSGPAVILISGLSLLAGTGGGFYVLLGGIVVSIFLGVVNAWVLLVEILR